MPPRHAGLPGAAVAMCLALAFAGCVGSDGAATRLQVSEGSGGLVVYVVLEAGALSRGQAWWAEGAPELDLQVGAVVPGWEALVVKNDVVLERLAIAGTEERAFLVWRSGDAGAVAAAGDEFEFIVVDTTGGGTLGSFVVAIEA